MKKIVILEKDPNKIKNFVNHINRDVNGDVNSIARICKIFVFQNTNQNDYDINELKNELGIDICFINVWNFREELDKLYADPDTVFLFNENLGEKLEENVFEYRINVNYALRKKAGNDDYRIWFYSFAGNDVEKEIEEVFPGHVLVPLIKENQIEDIVCPDAFI